MLVWHQKTYNYEEGKFDINRVLSNHNLVVKIPLHGYCIVVFTSRAGGLAEGMVEHPAVGGQQRAGPHQGHTGSAGTACPQVEGKLIMVVHVGVGSDQGAGGILQLAVTGGGAGAGEVARVVHVDPHGSLVADCQLGRGRERL